MPYMQTDRAEAKGISVLRLLARAKAIYRRGAAIPSREKGHSRLAAQEGPSHLPSGLSTQLELPEAQLLPLLCQLRAVAHLQVGITNVGIHHEGPWVVCHLCCR